MSKLIEKEGRFYKECGVVMLGTKEESNLHLTVDRGILLFGNKEFPEEPYPNLKSQHIYITSDDEIKEGDWIYHPLDIKPIQFYSTVDLLDPLTYGYKKIIATTDTSLGLPQPSDKFIQAFIEAYNKGEKIEKVLVEYELGKCSKESCDAFSCDANPLGCNYPEYLKPKLKDNKIIIKKVKDKLECNRSQLLKLVHDVADFIENKNSTEFNIDKWIEENL